MNDTDCFAFLSDARTLAVGIMLLCYLILFSEKVNRAVVTLLGACFMIFAGVLTQNQAFAGIDFNTISLLVGMMTIVNVTEKTGLFQFVAIWSAQKVRAKPVGILIALSAVTAIFSAFLDNVTTVLLIVPVTFRITGRLGLNPMPFLLLEIFSANIGGTATLIGDPPNILIGSALGLSFMSFLKFMTPMVLFVNALCIAVFVLIRKKQLTTTRRKRYELMHVRAADSLTDTKLLKASLSVLAAVIIGFMAAEHLHLANGAIALCGAAVLLELYTRNDKNSRRDEKTEDIFNLVDWTTILFFCGLFMIVHGLEVTGILTDLGRWLASLTDNAVQKTTFMILWISAVFSSAIDNIPFVATMIPILKSMESSMGGREAMMPVWWALSVGACFGGNGTLIGASANVIVAGLAQRHGAPISFGGFLLWSIPVMLGSVFLAGVYIYLVYFLP